MPREVAESCVDLLLVEAVGALSANGEPAEPALEAIGVAVGFKLAERAAAARPAFVDALDAIKFVCKEFWTDAFRKQVDNLRTNHRGVYVLMDNRVRWLARLAPPKAGAAAGPTAESFARFSCGLIRGALAALGIDAAVSAELSAQPGACQFTVKVAQPPAAAGRPA